MQIRPQTDPHMLRVLGTDGAAWAAAYLKQRQHFDGDGQHIELTAWFDTAMENALDRAANDVGERIASEFRGFWAAEDLAEEIPGMIRGARDSRHPAAP